MPRKRRPSTQNEISTTLRLLKLHLRNHPADMTHDAVAECIRQLRALDRETLFAENQATTQTPSPEKRRPTP